MGKAMITIKSKISFYSQENKLIGYLYQPDNIVDNEVRSTILLVPPQAGVKEQTVDEYAQRLSAHGFICLTFDHATFGDSEGEPRFYENPYNKSEDISAAVTYLSTLDIVDKKSIFGLGICSGGGYLSHTAVTDRRISKVATVNAYFDHRGFYRSLFSQKNLDELLSSVNNARLQFVNGEAISYLPHAPENCTPDMPKLFQEFYEYYMTDRGIKGKYESKFLPWSYEKLLTFSALDNANFLAPTPLLMIIGELAGSKNESEQMYKEASEPKELFEIGGANHIDLYDKSIFVERAIDKLIAFYRS